MDLHTTILDVRKKSGLSQEEFAEKLYVTRQAVSRWENGETTPTLDMIKMVAEIFNVDANTLLGLRETPVCQSCAMPLKNIGDFGTNADKTANTEYCQYCFDSGSFSHERSLEEMVESNLKFLSEFNAGNGTNYTEDDARNILKLHLATLKRWKKN